MIPTTKKLVLKTLLLIFVFMQFGCQQKEKSPLVKQSGAIDDLESLNKFKDEYLRYYEASLLSEVNPKKAGEIRHTKIMELSKWKKFKNTLDRETLDKIKYPGELEFRDTFNYKLFIGCYVQNKNIEDTLYHIEYDLNFSRVVYYDGSKIWFLKDGTYDYWYKKNSLDDIDINLSYANLLSNNLSILSNSSEIKKGHLRVAVNAGAEFFCNKDKIIHKKTPKNSEIEDFDHDAIRELFDVKGDIIIRTNAPLARDSILKVTD